MKQSSQAVRIDAKKLHLVMPQRESNCGDAEVDRECKELPVTIYLLLEIILFDDTSYEFVVMKTIKCLKKLFLM